MEVIDCIQSRRSVRKFSDKKVDYNTIIDLIKIGTYAPTAQMREPWGFVVIQDKEEMKRLSDMAKVDILERLDELPQFKNYEKFFSDPEFNIFYEAENLLLVYGDTTTRWYKEDCSALAENIILAAFSQNIGTCWIGFSKDLFDSKEFKEKYNIPESYESVSALILGYMNFIPNPPKRREPIIFSRGK